MQEPVGAVVDEDAHGVGTLGERHGLSVEPSFEMGPLYLYKVRDAEPMPEYEDGPSDPCHPLHLGMKYAWGGSWTRTVASGMGSTVQTSGTTTPSWAASGGGTADLPGGGVLITLRCDAHLHAMDPVEGVVIRVDQVTWQGQEVSFDGVDEGPTNGCRMVGDGGALARAAEFGFRESPGDADERAIARAERDDASVVPVLLRAVDIEGAPFAKLQGLPTDLRPVTSWPNRDEAWTDVAKGIRRTVEAIQQLTAGFGADVTTLGGPKPPGTGP